MASATATKGAANLANMMIMCLRGCVQTVGNLCQPEDWGLGKAWIGITCVKKVRPTRRIQTKCKDCELGNLAEQG